MASVLVTTCALLVSLTAGVRVMNGDNVTLVTHRAGGDYGSCPETNAVCVIIRMRPPKSMNPNNPGGSILTETGECTRCIELKGVKTMYPFDVIFPYTEEESEDGDSPITGSVPSNDDVVDTTVTPQVNMAFACEDPGKPCQTTAFFAYGATGSGKSHTMGFGDTPGVMQAGVRQVFEKLADFKDRGHILGKLKAWVTFYELYGDNEYGTQVYDSLQKKKNLGKKGGQGSILKNLRFVKCETYEEFDKTLAEGFKFRSVGATGMNAVSSRSHGIVTLVLTEQDLTKFSAQKGTEMYHSSTRLSFIDLAGSEPAGDWLNKEKYPTLECAGKMTTDQCRQLRFQEGNLINQGLTMLSKCIGAAAGLKNLVCSPRENMLTVMLSDLFEKDKKTGRALSFTRMIAALNPSDDPNQLALTKGTLNYASTVKKIKVEAPTGNSGPKAKALSAAQIIADLKAQLETVTAQNVELLGNTEELQNVATDSAETKQRLEEMERLLEESKRQQELIESEAQQRINEAETRALREVENFKDASAETATRLKKYEENLRAAEENEKQLAEEVEKLGALQGVEEKLEAAKSDLENSHGQTGELQKEVETLKSELVQRELHEKTLEQQRVDEMERLLEESKKNQELIESEAQQRVNEAESRALKEAENWMEASEETAARLEEYEENLRNAKENERQLADEVAKLGVLQGVEQQLDVASSNLANSQSQTGELQNEVEILKAELVQRQLREKTLVEEAAQKLARLEEAQQNVRRQEQEDLRKQEQEDKSVDSRTALVKAKEELERQVAHHLDQIVDKDDAVDFAFLFNVKSEFVVAGRRYKCCVYAKDLNRYNIQDVTHEASVPRARTFNCWNRRGCGCMFGDHWHSFDYTKSTSGFIDGACTKKPSEFAAITGISTGHVKDLLKGSK